MACVPLFCSYHILTSSMIHLLSGWSIEMFEKTEFMNIVYSLICKPVTIFFYKIAGEPGRPIIYEPKDMYLEETSFTLKWRRPQDDGGDKNIEYIVRYRDETERKAGPWKEFVTKKQEHRIKSLGKDKIYKVEMMARNKGGNSSPDERFYLTTQIRSKIYVFSNIFIVSYHIL